MCIGIGLSCSGGESTNDESLFGLSCGGKDSSGNESGIGIGELMMSGAFQGKAGWRWYVGHLS